MPSIQQILLGLEEITNTWKMVAILWHVFFGVLSISLAVGARPSQRAAGIMLALPMFSVSALAWISSNPFNGSVYALVGILLVYIAARLPRDPVDFAPTWGVIAGSLLALFGWVYPHFLNTPSVLSYAYAAPTGLIPCPTLSIVIGFTLILDRFRSRAYSLTLGLTGLFYGVTGFAQLGVQIDLVLLAGAALLVVLSFVKRHREPSIAQKPSAIRMTMMGIAPWLAGITIAYAVVALCVHYTNLETMVIPGSSDSAFTIIGAILGVIGIVLWGSGAVGILKAFREGKLVKGGVFAITRNPMYCGFIVFLTGFALWLRSWPVLTVPIVAYIVFKLLVEKEEKYLEEKFGQEYLEYKLRVNSIIPLIRVRT
jgi:protein-S-isoprenylcysteine O-methyltransferase Ste14